MLLSSSVYATDYLVTDPGDDGSVGQLRWAINQAALNPGPDRILFDLQGITPIKLVSSITISTPVEILGYSDPGSGEGTIPARTIAVGIDAKSTDDGLIIATGNVTISGIAIYGAQRALVVTAAGGDGGPVKIQGCYIGITEYTIPFGNAIYGIDLEADAPGTYSYSNPRVIIGTDGDGNNDANEGNLISANTGDGINIYNCDNIVIAGNYIGTTSGGANWTNGNLTGITIDGGLSGTGSSNNRIGTNGDGVSDALERNVISANRENGVVITNRGSGNIVAGNYIGISAAGAAAGNKGVNGFNYFSGNGILLSQVTNTIVGVSPTGGVVAQRNLIGSNVRNGITIYSGGLLNPATGNIVAGNTIGANLAGTARPNEFWGIQLVNLGNGVVTGNIIGSNDDGSGDNIEANIIANNKKDGVAMLQNNTGTVNQNRVSRNSFFNNSGTATDGQGFGMAVNLLAAPLFAADGITLNDAGDGDTGPNDLLNYPVITLFGVDNSFANVVGTAPAGSLIQFYLASADAVVGAPTYNEGQTYLGAAQDNGPLDTDPTPGAFNFLFGQSTLSTTVTAGAQVNAIAISSLTGAGNASEFGATATTVLPVQFLSFTATLQGDKVQVAWATAQEQNASHFEVEKSINGTDFTNIGSVKAKGNSNSTTNYSYTDNASLGVSYYRLRQVDLDGRFVYTKTVVIRNESRNKAFSVWPNPVIDNVNITLQSDRNQNLNVRVVDYNGRVVRSQQFNAIRGTNQVTLNFANLSKGMYLIQVVGENLNLNDKVIKQ